MAFLYPNYFPAGCVVETDSDPADLRYAGFQFYPVGVSLEQAMAWIWKSRAFTGSGGGQILNSCCDNENPSPVYTEFTFPNSQSTSGVDAAKTKMTELICPTSYVADFVFFGTRIDNDCDGGSPTATAEAGFSFFINDPNIVINPEQPVYLYNGKYYIPIFYNTGSGSTLNDPGATFFAGNLTIDDIDFPLYSAPPECNDEPIANFSCTTTLEREAN